MLPVFEEYSLPAAISTFFEQTCATREACDLKALSLTGGGTQVIPVPVQGICSYTVYAGPSFESVVQFRLEALGTDDETLALAAEIYGSLVPIAQYEGTLGHGEGGLTEVKVYVMPRVRGVTYLDYFLEHGFPVDSVENVGRRKVLMGDIGRFMALSWNSPQSVSAAYREDLRSAYGRDLELLRSGLPKRFTPIVQRCIDNLDAIFELPMALLHKDFGECNIMVDEQTCHLVGVIDWAEAEICPFGLNLHALQQVTGRLHLRNGWSRYGDYDALEEVFRERFTADVKGDVTQDQLKTIKLARALGLLLSKGFTSRLKNMPAPKVIGDDEYGRYNMLSLDGFLIDPATRFDGLD